MIYDLATFSIAALSVIILPFSPMGFMALFSLITEFKSLLYLSRMKQIPMWKKVSLTSHFLAKSLQFTALFSGYLLTIPILIFYSGSFVAQIIIIRMNFVFEAIIKVYKLMRILGCLQIILIFIEYDNKETVKYILMPTFLATVIGIPVLLVFFLNLLYLIFISRKQFSIVRGALWTIIGIVVICFLLLYIILRNEYDGLFLDQDKAKIGLVVIAISFGFLAGTGIILKNDIL